MADLFKSPTRMLGRAKHHLADLEARIKPFQSKPWTAIVEKEADGVGQLIKIKFSERLADDLSNIVFDCANNLRSVLDQIGFATAVKHTGLANPKATKFPFAPTEADLANQLAGGCKDLPPEIRDLFAAFKPYKGGNNALWAMNELCNTPKHKMLYPLAMGLGSMSMGGTVTIGAGGIIFMPSHDGWDSEKNELVFARIPNPDDVKGQLNFNIACTVAFHEVDEVIRGQNPIKALRAMTGEVERILVAAERECRRIGLIV